MMAKKKRERKSYVSKKERREKAMIASHRDSRMDKRLLAVHLMVPTVPDILHTRLGKGCGRISASVPFKLAEC